MPHGAGFAQVFWRAVWEAAAGDKIACATKQKNHILFSGILAWGETAMQFKIFSLAEQVAVEHPRV